MPINPAICKHSVLCTASRAQGARCALVVDPPHFVEPFLE
jgi:hypothetical protein